MNDTTTGLRRKIGSAGDLQSVIRSMKALAASNIGQYEKSVNASLDYYRMIELGLSVCFKEIGAGSLAGFNNQTGVKIIGAVVFGSDQGLVGQFNDAVADHAKKILAELMVERKVWAVGERVRDLLSDAGQPLTGLFIVPNSVRVISRLVGQILVDCETQLGFNEFTELHLFYNRPISGTLYEPVNRRLLPLDENWRRTLYDLPWPTKKIPEVTGDRVKTIRALISEYLFISLFRACAESLASENASRLSSMQRADKNIDELLEDLNGKYHRMRQNGIDEELFDVISGFEALSKGKYRK